MNILYATCFLDISGVTKLNFDILKTLACEFKVHICVTHRDDCLVSTWDERFASAFMPPIKLWRIPSSNRYRYFVEYLKKNQIHLVYITHSLWLYQHIVSLKRDLPYLKIVDSLHVLEPYCFRGGYPDISANRFVHPYIDKSIIISKNLLQYISRHYRVDINKFVVIKNGIDTNKFKPETELHGNFKDELGVPLPNYLVGFIGRLTEQKRPLLFVDAAYELAINNPNFYFYMVGSGKLENKVKERIARLGLNDRIRIFRQRDDVQFVLNSTDVLMVTSSYEGAPLTILEALAVGVPVVATDVGAIAEYVNDRCILVSCKVSSEEKKEFSEAALRCIKKDKCFTPLDVTFRLENVTSSYRAVFKSLFL